MTKMEITIKADELIAAIEKLIAALDGKQVEKTIEASVEPAIAEKEEKTETEPLKAVPITIEKVRAVLAEKSQSGKQPQVKALITKYGAKKLTDIDPACYAELFKEAEVL